MVKVIMGQKGTGKTKLLIELANKAAGDENGDVVCLAHGDKLNFDISHSVRLIDTKNYSFSGYEFLKGYISGLHSANYDISYIFIDSLLKIIHEDVNENLEKFLDWCSEFCEKEHIKFTVLISADVSLATEGVKKYFVK